MNKILSFVKENATLLVLGLITILLLFIAIQSAGTVSLLNLEEVEIYTSIIDKFGSWTLLLVLSSVISFIAITGKGGALDHSISVELEELQDSKRFTQMEIDMENAPQHIKQIVETGNALLKAANSMLELESVEKLVDIIEDLSDGPEPEDVVKK